MNTPTHFLAAAAILSRAHSPRRNMAIAAGALAPDLSIFIFFAWTQAFTQLSMPEIWNEAYWTEPWQTLGAISNSAPIALALLGVGVWRKAPLLTVFSLALLVHAGLDFPLHADDAHRHFWPFTDWRFHSPVSYWDASHHAIIGALIELSVFLAAVIVLWRRFEARWVRICVAATTVVYLAAGGFFYGAFSF